MHRPGLGLWLQTMVHMDSQQAIKVRRTHSGGTQMKQYRGIEPTAEGNQESRPRERSVKLIEKLSGLKDSGEMECSALQSGQS